jgi:hypothetical protein
MRDYKRKESKLNNKDNNCKLMITLIINISIAIISYHIGFIYTAQANGLAWSHFVYL